MKKILIIGSTVCDIVIQLKEHLPRTGEDVHVLSQHMSLGGCAYNVSDSVRHFGVPYILFSPIGTGVYGQFVRESLLERGITSPVPTPGTDNGCCYCFVEPAGERTFICYHGAEYQFRREWFDLIDIEEICSVYICGLEIEEPTGEAIVSFLEAHPGLRVFFAPGPRITRIDPALRDRLYRLSPVLHLNEDEALAASGCNTVSAGARALGKMTGNLVMVTLGRKGCYYFDPESGHSETIPAFPAKQADTIGAGDAHIGSVMACLARGDALPDAIRSANLVSAAVVEVSGALLPDERFAELRTPPHDSLS